jgi:hypothetical protein
MAVIEGVEVVGGVVEVIAPRPGRNVMIFEVNPNNNRIKITLNDAWYEFPEGTQLWSLSYQGGGQGGDRVRCSVSGVNTSINVMGGGNQVYGGPAWNTVNLADDNNTYDAQGGSGYVFSTNGPHDKVADSPRVLVFHQTFVPWNAPRWRVRHKSASYAKQAKQPRSDRGE